MKRRLGDPDAKEMPQPFQTIEELREVGDVKDRDWFGEEKKAGLKDLLTCWGDGKININTASGAVLKCIPHLRGNAIGAILAYRAGSDGKLYTEDDQDFKSLEDLSEKTDISGDALATLQQHCKVDSQFFTITGVATLRQGKVIASCVATVMVEGPSAMVIKWREEIVES